MALQSFSNPNDAETCTQTRATQPAGAVLPYLLYYSGFGRKINT